MSQAIAQNRQWAEFLRSLHISAKPCPPKVESLEDIYARAREKGEAEYYGDMPGDDE